MNRFLHTCVHSCVFVWFDFFGKLTLIKFFNYRIIESVMLALIRIIHMYNSWIINKLDYTLIWNTCIYSASDVTCNSVSVFGLHNILAPSLLANCKGDDTLLFYLIHQPRYNTHVIRYNPIFLKFANIILEILRSQNCYIHFELAAGLIFPVIKSLDGGPISTLAKKKPCIIAFNAHVFVHTVWT